MKQDRRKKRDERRKAKDGRTRKKEDGGERKWLPEVSNPVLFKIGPACFSDSQPRRLGAETCG